MKVVFMPNNALHHRYQILPRPMFDSDHLLNAYDTEAPANAHKLACVFLVMAIGVMFDLSRPPCEFTRC